MARPHSQRLAINIVSAGKAITLELFKDPVQTIHGQVYERNGIERWFRTNNIDPLTGETLITTAVFPDNDMRILCERYIKGPPKIGGRGGRGRP